MSHKRCPCGKSSDGWKEYKDGGYCFVCGKKEFTKDDSDTKVLERDVGPKYEYNLQNLEFRGITKDTLRRYRAYVRVDKDGNPRQVEIPYGKAINLRKWNNESPGPKYKFEGEGDHILGGSDIFPKGSAKAVTVCEGGLDGFSAFQLLGSQYPVVYVRSASSAKKECQSAHEYLNSFERIYISFDNDEAGHKATEEVCKLFDINKVFNVKIDNFNDVNEMLQAGAGDKYVKMWWNAKRFVPDGFLSSYDEIAKVLEERPPEPLATYPWPSVQKATYGIFPAQFILVKAQTKIGKTEFISHIEDHILQTTDLNIGIIHIEDTKDRVIKRFATYELGRPVHLPDSFATNEEVLDAYIKRTKRDNRVHIYSHFGSKDPAIIVDAIRYLIAVAGCRIVFLDHVSMVVSGLADEDERKVLDALGTNLATLANDLDAVIFGVSHVNDAGRTRSSRIMEQVAHVILNLERDKTADDLIERNTTKVTIEGNRLGSITGRMADLVFDPKTWRIEEKKELAQLILPI